jgi:hypothetical protein
VFSWRYDRHLLVMYQYYLSQLHSLPLPTFRKSCSSPMSVWTLQFFNIKINWYWFIASYTICSDKWTTEVILSQMLSNTWKIMSQTNFELSPTTSKLKENEIYLVPYHMLKEINFKVMRNLLIRTVFCKTPTWILLSEGEHKWRGFT